MSANPLRRRLFAQLNGLVFAPVAHALHERGVTGYLLEQREASLDELAQKFGANAGYLNVGLRCLASMGYLDYAVDGEGSTVRLRINDRSAPAFPLFAHYGPLVQFQRLTVRSTEFFHPVVLDPLAALVERYAAGWIPESSGGEGARREREEILLHIEGGLVGPLLVHMGMAGALADLDQGVDLRCFGDHDKASASVAQLLERMGWATPGDRPLPTPDGRFFLERAASYGVPVSYLPMLTASAELMFGNAATLLRQSISEDEHHVDRRMNIWGSGGNHGQYFAALEQAVIDQFDRPIEAQPAGIVDVGCGDGALLARLYRVVTTKTRRGQMLDAHPLRLFGVDYNRAALEVTRRQLARAGVPATLLWGDVGRPDLLAKTLERDHGVKLGDLLNVRTFLDHNRPWTSPATPGSVHEPRSTGAFAHRGLRVAPPDVERGLTEHLQRWTPYVQRHGLLVVELHTLDPQLAATHVGATLAPAYDATHGFSDQYILELGAFERAAAAAGLYADAAVYKRFPDSGLATVSVNLLRERRRQQR